MHVVKVVLIRAHVQKLMLTVEVFQSLSYYSAVCMLVRKCYLC